MKVLITLASVLILSANATAENDMAFYSMEADTCFMQTETCVDVPICDIALCEQEEAKVLQPQKATAKKAQKAKKKRITHTQQKSLAPWYQKISKAANAVWSAIEQFGEWISSPVRPVWGEYEEKGQNTSAPLALFRRSSFQQDKAAIIAQIQITGSDFRNIYKNIYEYATNTPGGWGTEDFETPNAVYAKNAAFVLLMGVDNTGAALSPTVEATIKSNLVSILNSCFSNTPDDWFEGGDWDDVHQYRSKDLINYCCAYELLRTADGNTNYNDAREQIKKYASELYSQSTDWFSSLSNVLNNNIVLMTAAALGTAGMVCHDKKDYLWKPWKHPNRWVNKAFARINQSEFSSWTHTESERGGVYGQKEGPLYYFYAMENLMPMFVMFNNYVNENKDFSALYPENLPYGVTSLMTLGTAYLLTIERVKNFIHDPDWENTWIWYTDLVQANGAAVSYDDTREHLASSLFACTKKQQFSLLKGDAFVGSVGNQGADILAANNPSNGTNKVNLYRNRVNKQSGDIMFRTKLSDDINGQHYLHALAEPYPGILETARLKISGIAGEGHEHADALSFTISAGNEQLAIDPPYITYSGFRNEISKGEAHNLITINGKGPSLTDFPTISDYNETTQTVQMYNSYEGAIVIRKIKVHYEKGSSAPYYEIIDFAGSGLTPAVFRFNLNGNGLRSAGSCDDSKLQTEGSVVWKYPCEKGRDWGMYAKVTPSLPTGTIFNVTDNHKHGNSATGSGNVLCGDELINVSKDFNYSYHSRLEVEQLGFIGLFQTIIKPMTCDEISAIGTPAEKGKVRSSIDTSRTVTIVDSIGDDNRRNIHVARTTNSYPLVINNPMLEMGSGPFPDMNIQAEYGFLSVSPDNVFVDYNCATYTKFRASAMDAGLLLRYNDTTYLEANDFVDTKFSLTGKFKYEGYCTTRSNAATVSYFLPDLTQGIEMVTIGKNISFTYDTITFIMKVTFPANETTSFRFEMADMCKVNCFYPDTNTHIVNSFVQSGRVEYMPYKLKILQPSGQLIMNGGAKMNICEYKWLNNRDSLIMYALPSEKNAYALPSKCNPEQLTNRAYDIENPRTAIVVGQNASLVLDSGSYTRVGANSSIYVLSGGSLIVKPYAVLEIGSEDAEGYGEILADQDAYICVAPEAIIKFHRNDKDSVDKNLFYVVMKDYLPQVSKTKAGISPVVYSMLISDTLIPSDGYLPCTPFCDFKNILPPYGIINRDWGYAPFVMPRATYTISGDTVCPGDSVIVNMQKVLNETGYQFSVCRVQDTLKTTPCNNDTLNIFEDFLQIADGCTERVFTPDDYRFMFWDSGWYRVKMVVVNECDISHDSTRYIYVPAPPDVVLNIPDSICPGVGTLIADGSQTNSHSINTIYRWSISLIVPDSMRQQDVGIDYGGDWGDFDSSAVSNAFDFPNFRFYGGLKYAVGLSVKGWCGWVTKWDTVNVPLSVYLNTHLATNYQNPVGPASFELQGYVTGATSYAWIPTNDLDEPDSLRTIVRPSAPITYILEVYDGNSCYDYDTIEVAHNDIAYAGADNILCEREPVFLGTHYNGFSLLAILKNPTKVDEMLRLYNYNDYEVNKYLTHCMIRANEEFELDYIDKFKVDTLLQHYLTTLPDYATYYAAFSSGSIEDAVGAINNINNTINNDEWLTNYLLNNGYAIDDEGIEEIFTSYANNFAPHLKYEIQWEYKKMTDTLWTPDTEHWNFNRVSVDTVTTTYRLTIHDIYNSILEYDEIQLNRDTTITVNFAPLMIIDSTVWFDNFSHPVNEYTVYSWSFGDGETSTYKYPSHTFPSSDSTYIICLTTTNKCDSYVSCDTLTLDELGMHFTYRKSNPNSKPTLLQTDNNKDKTKLIIADTVQNHDVFIINNPNPFSDKTFIEYEIGNEYKNTEIRITNVLGQTMKTIKLKAQKGSTLIDCTQWSPGMYFYTLVIDGVVIQSKRMILER